MTTVSVNGLSMHVEQAGTGDEAVLLLHGALSDALQNYRLLIPLLSERYRLVAPDLRGHGRTDNPTGEFSLDLLTTDVLGLMDALGLRRVHVLGSSLGGYIALAARAASPERFASIALAGVHLDWTLADARDRAGFFTPEAIAAEYPLWVPQLAKAHAAHYGPEHWKTIVGLVGPLLGTLVDEPRTGLAMLASEKLPLFYVTGDRDRLAILENVPRVARARPDAEIMVVPRAGHLFREYDQELFARAYRNFLRRRRGGN